MGYTCNYSSWAEIGKIQTSKMDVLQLLRISWDEFLDSIVQNSFTSSEYYFKDVIDYIRETEYESDYNLRVKFLLLAFWLPTVNKEHDLLFKIESYTTRLTTVQSGLTIRDLSRDCQLSKLAICELGTTISG